MKHYDKLTNLESQIINLQCLESLTRALATGLPDCRSEDIENTMWHISDQIEAIHGKLRSEFNALFDEIREESFKNETKKPRNKSKKPL